MTPARTLRALPAVESLLQSEALGPVLASVPRAVVVGAVREEIAGERARRKRGMPPSSPGELAERAAGRARRDARRQLRRVLNATGVVLHTNLGRAPLAVAARAAVAEIAAGYCSLEYDLGTGTRGDRGTGVERWLTRLTGAGAAAVVNNGAAALLLALSALASGRRVVVSRGELIEIGGSFRIPEILEKSGATLVEVGTTNRTHLRDYERALDRWGDVGAVLRVHRSNFRQLGFTAQPDPRALAALAHRHRVPFVEDLGSGALVDLAAFGLEHEPTVRESLAAGADIVTCSGDKLLGASQAGLLIGARRWIERARRDPLARALRLDKLQLVALEATLPLYADPSAATREVPALAMLVSSADVQEPRARRLADALAGQIPQLKARVVRGDGEVGGGALPVQRLPGWVVELEHPELDARALEAHARAADPALIGTIRGARFRLDPRTLADDEISEAAASLARSLRSYGDGGAVAPARFGRAGTAPGDGPGPEPRS